MATKPAFTNVPHIQGTEFQNSDSTNKKTVFTAASGGSRIESVGICSNDGTNRNVSFFLNDGTNDHYVNVVPVPLSSGYGTVARVEGITSLGTPAGVINLPNGWLLKAAMVVAVTTADVLTVTVQGGDF